MKTCLPKWLTFLLHFLCLKRKLGKYVHEKHFADRKIYRSGGFPSKVCGDNEINVCCILCLKYEEGLESKIDSKFNLEIVLAKTCNLARNFLMLP